MILLHQLETVLQNLDIPHIFQKAYSMRQLRGRQLRVGHRPGKGRGRGLSQPQYRVDHAGGGQKGIGLFVAVLSTTLWTLQSDLDLVGTIRRLPVAVRGGFGQLAETSQAQLKLTRRSGAVQRIQNVGRIHGFAAERTFFRTHGPHDDWLWRATLVPCAWFCFWRNPNPARQASTSTKSRSKTRPTRQFFATRSKRRPPLPTSKVL